VKNERENPDLLLALIAQDEKIRFTMLMPLFTGIKSVEERHE
jgi:hypothetical protein